MAEMSVAVTRKAPSSPASSPLCEISLSWGFPGTVTGAVCGTVTGLTVPVYAGIARAPGLRVSVGAALSQSRRVPGCVPEQGRGTHRQRDICSSPPLGHLGAFCALHIRLSFREKRTVAGLLPPGKVILSHFRVRCKYFFPSLKYV